MSPSSEPNSKPTFRPIWLGYIGLLGFLTDLHPVLSPLRFLFLFSLLYLAYLLWSIGSFLFSLVAPRKPVSRSGHSHSAARQPPLPGSAARRSMARFLLNYACSICLTFLNPLQLTQMIAQIFGQFVASVRRRGRFPSPTTFEQQATYFLPFRGEWYVYNGGSTPQTSHSWDVLGQRYAYDFVVADKQLERHTAEGGAKVQDYYAYNQDIIAPAAGTVVWVRDGVRDAPRVGTGWIDWLSTDFRGNMVILQHAPSEYSVLAHFVPHTIVVQQEQQVQRGDLLGKCGNSGHSTEPHLHFHVQDHPRFYFGVGLLIRFSQVEINKQLHPTAVLEAGTHIQQAIEMTS